MHDEHNVLHRDLKTQNVILTTYNDLKKCVIIDFGLATKNNSEARNLFGNAGTLIF